jgi:hypothetical protein
MFTTINNKQNLNKGNNKITELRTIFQRESQNMNSIFMDLM